MTCRPCRPRPRVLLLLVMACGAGAAMAQYKWKDSRGQVQFSDQPPPREVPDKDILQRPAAGARRAPADSTAAATGLPASASGTGRAAQDTELQARRKKAEQEATARQQADEQRLAAQRADNCQRARQQIAMLETGQRIQRLNERGERVILDDAARNAELDVARRLADADCR